MINYCNREEGPAWTELNFDLCRGDWIFWRVSEGVGMGNFFGLNRVGEMEIFKRGLFHVKLIWVRPLLLMIKVLLLSSHRDWETGSVFRCWLKQSGIPFGSPELSQSGTKEGRSHLLGMLPWVVKNYVSVCSSLLMWQCVVVDEMICTENLWFL